MIFYHADDYGITIEQAKAILACTEEGVCNSVSVMPNSPVLKEAMELLGERQADKPIRRVIHLNLIEGPSSALAAEVPLLVDETGKLSCSFGKLLKVNYSLGSTRKKYLEQLTTEIEAQILAVLESNQISETGISLDSHQHLHMIPIVWEAMEHVIIRHQLTVENIRIPVDPLEPVLSTPSCFWRMRPVNMVKWMVLKFLSIGKRKRVRRLGATSPVFFGIFYTCQMEYPVVSKMLYKYRRIADRKGNSLELMFHPGKIENREELLDAGQQGLVEFYKSDYRDLEAETLRKL